MRTGIRIQHSGFRGAKKAFSIQDSGFRIQDSGELFLHFSILPPQHVRHASAGWHPIFFFPKNAKKVSVASFGTTKMGFQTPFSFVSLAQRRRENVSGMTGVGVGDERKDSAFRIQDLGFSIQDSGFRGAKKAFSIWRLAFRKFSCFCLSQFSKLFRHPRESGDPSPDGNVYQFFAAESADSCRKIRRWALFLQHPIFLYLSVMDPRFHGDDGKGAGVLESWEGCFLKVTSLFFRNCDDLRRMGS